MLSAISGGNIKSEQPAQSAHIDDISTTVVKVGPGVLKKIIINSTLALAVINIYDNTAASGTVIGIITQPAVVLNNQIELNFNVEFLTGLTIQTVTAIQDITVVYL